MKTIIPFFAFSLLAMSQGSIVRDGCAAASGSGTTYTCSYAVSPGSYVTGHIYSFEADVANTGAATINLNSLGAKSITKVQGGITTPLVANDIRAGQWITMIYDDTEMQMLSQLGNAAGGGGTASTPYWWSPWLWSTSDPLVVPQSSAVWYWMITPALSQTIDHLVAAAAGANTNHYAFAIYSSSCNLIAASAANAFPGGADQTAALSTSLTAGTTYFLALSSDSANGTDKVDAINNSGLASALNLGLTTGVFIGANTATWSAGSVTFPGTCGTKTAAAKDFPAIVFY